MELAGLEPAASWVRSSEASGCFEAKAADQQELCARADGVLRRGCRRIIGDVLWIQALSAMSA